MSEEDYLSIEEDNDSDIEETDIDETEEILQQNSSKSISACYEEYLKDNKLLLTPEYQRDFLLEYRKTKCSIRYYL